MTVQIITPDEINQSRELIEAWWEAMIHHDAKTKEDFLRRLDLLEHCMPFSSVGRRLLAAIRKDADRLLRA